MFLYVLLFASQVFAADGFMKDFDSLGENKVLHDQAQALQPDKKITVIQKRIVNREKRHEFYPEFLQVTNGDNPYFTSRASALNYQFHINPNWSIGAQYAYYYNDLSKEGKTLIDEGSQLPTESSSAFIPQLNWLKSSTLATIDWYPIYGKLSVFEEAVVHFDLYATLGYGEMQLRFNKSELMQAGLGLGFWWSQHFSSRIEYKMQSYTAKYYDGDKKINNGTVSLGLGYLL